jgi:hypothetical protein
MAEDSLLARGATGPARSVRGRALAFVLVAGCSGQITGAGPNNIDIGVGGGAGIAGSSGSGAGATGSTGIAGSSGGSPGTAALPPSAPLGPLRRLSRAQYNNTVRDLLGDTSRPADAFVAEEVAGSFVGSVALTQAAPAAVEQYEKAAEALAATAVKNLAKLVGCTPTAATEESCAQTFIGAFGARAYRRPLAADERANLLAVYRAVRGVGDFSLAIQAVTQAMLQSPHFLYRVDLPPAGATPGQVAPLGPYALASRLSYFLLDTMPDETLFASAAAGKLATPADLEREARRLLATPAARDAAAGFFQQWLLLGKLDAQGKDAKLFPEYTEALRAAMREETLRFSTWALFDGDGRFETLLTSPRSMINAPLAKLYGVGAPAGTGFATVDLDPKQRSGLLTHASILALTSNDDTTSPVRRGKFVLDQLLCQSPPAPPPNVDTTFPAPVPGQTLRERFATHTTNTTCAACHLFIDPIGFGFEHYDPVGRYRDTDAGKPVDASGQIKGTRDINGPFDGAIELGRKLVASPQARACMVKQWFAFAHGRPDAAGDQAAMNAIVDTFERSGGNVRELIIALVKSDAFRTRLVEVTQ